jgi:hypothetical protein
MVVRVKTSAVACSQTAAKRPREGYGAARALGSARGRGLAHDVFAVIRGVWALYQGHVFHEDLRSAA